MPISLKKLVQHEAYKIVWLQLGAVFCLAIVALPLFGERIALALLSGGIAYGFPNLILVWLVFRFVGAQQMALFMGAFFAGEMFKLFLSAILVLMIVKYLPDSLLSVLVGFIWAIISFWIVCMWHFTKKKVRSG